MLEHLRWKKYPVLNDGHICLVDCMGDDAAIVQAARISYGKDKRLLDSHKCPKCGGEGRWRMGQEFEHMKRCYSCHEVWVPESNSLELEISKQDQHLIRYLLAHGHTTPFEMVEFKFRVRVPMDCWRQWVRHRTANINEYSTRYSEAIDSFQTTEPTEWRLQASSNKQGSEGFVEDKQSQDFLDFEEASLQEHARQVYINRLNKGIAKEQARKDLPLSTYTEAYWKCDLHNLFNFLRLRMDSHAQYEIRMYANAMAEIVKQVVPVAWEAFEDYVLYAKRFSRMEMEMLRHVLENGWLIEGSHNKPDSMTQREWKEFLEKLA